MLCTMRWTPFTDKCKLLLCAFVNWLGFSLTFLTKPLQRSHLPALYFLRRVANAEGMVPTCAVGALPLGFGVLSGLPALAVCRAGARQASGVSVCGGRYAQWVISWKAELKLGPWWLFAYCKKLTVIPPNPAGGNMSSRDDLKLGELVPNSFVACSGPTVGYPTENMLVWWSFPLVNIAAIVFHLLPLGLRMENCTWKVTWEFVTQVF